MKLRLAFLVLSALLVSSLASAAPSSQPADPSLKALWTAIFTPASVELASLAPKKTCTVTVRCPDGEVISCTGSTCLHTNCFVRCDGNFVVNCDPCTIQ